MHIILYLVTILAFLFPSNAYALKKENTKVINPETGYEEVFMPQLFSNSVIIDNNEEQPREPNIGEIKYLKLTPVNGINERVDRLIQGVKKDIPPEYDHYGHEIRRYMASVGNVKIFSDDDFIKEQIRNVRKSQVISNYWKRHIDEEIRAIDKVFEESSGISLAARTAFKQNKVTVRTFMLSLKGWLDANENLLMTVFNFEPDSFELIYPEIIINDSKSRLDYYNNFNARQVKLKELVAYTSFVIMVY